MAGGWRNQAKRYGAPLAFLLAATIAVLLVRSGLNSDAAPTTTSAPGWPASSRAGTAP